MNTTEGLAPLCRVLRISPCRVAIGLCFTENVKCALLAKMGLTRLVNKRCLVHFFIKKRYIER